MVLLSYTFYYAARALEDYIIPTAASNMNRAMKCYLPVEACTYVERLAVAILGIPRCQTNRSLLSPVNPIIAALLLVVLRVYSTLDNPYTPALGFLLSARLIYKMGSLDPIGLGNKEKVLAVCDILADSMLASVIIYTGVVPQHSSDPFISSLHILQGLYATVAVSSAMMTMGH